MAQIVDYGFPAGDGGSGTEELIKRVEVGLAERDLDAPSRTTVQATVKAVLLRERKAGN